jgi:site-specific DNA-methyltransferase (adenine-specific)
MHSTDGNSTIHKVVLGDARHMGFISDESVHLIVTSPPYWNLKEYNNTQNQLGHIEDYEEFLAELRKVWDECFRVLIPGGRLVCIVGDVCMSRRQHGRHRVMPLHADICVQCRKVGFDNLNPIIWYKISNAKFEANKGSKFLGKPYEPNAIIKNDIEYILMQRKPGGYRKPSDLQRRLSRIKKDDFNKWFRQIWNLTGASTNKHPAPFPLKLAQRLVQMFSFEGDTILDPFCGTGTTSIAAVKSNRNSIGIDIDASYCHIAARRIQKETEHFFNNAKLLCYISYQEKGQDDLIKEPKAFSDVCYKDTVKQC